MAPVKAPAKAPVSMLVTEQDPFTYVNSPARYTSKEFYGIIIDTGALRRLTAGYSQYLAYKRINKDANINTA